MRIILFVNDSYFSYLLAKPTIDKFHDHIQLVCYSNMIKGSFSRIFSVYRKVHFRYFCYRVIVDVISRINCSYNKRSVYSLVKKYNIQYSSEENINNSSLLETTLPSSFGLAFNFDQVIGKKILDLFEDGVINVHASRLPNDKGISPVLWAFARGDKTIWTSIYKMGEKLDTGLVYKQFSIPVVEKMTAFSLYESICFNAGYELASIVQLLINGQLEPLFESKETEGNYWGWPDKVHKKLMLDSGRRFISINDIFNSIRVKSPFDLSVDKQ